MKKGFSISGRYMQAYEFYRRDKEGDHLIGILPERRRSPKERITPESVIAWVKGVVGDIDLGSMYVVTVELENSVPKDFYKPTPLL